MPWNDDSEKYADEPDLYCNLFSFALDLVLLREDLDGDP
jgi:hypothetical protein